MKTIKEQVLDKDNKVWEHGNWLSREEIIDVTQALTAKQIFEEIENFGVEMGTICLNSKMSDRDKEKLDKLFGELKQKLKEKWGVK